MITLLVSAEEFAQEKLQVGGERYRHLFRARRATVGDRVRLVDGGGHARWSSVLSVDRSAATLAAGDPAATNEPPLYLELFSALPKPDRAAWLVEKVTEVGVSAVRFMRSERAPRELTSAALARLSRVAAAAVEQSHRARLPELSGPHAWTDLPSLLAGSEVRYVLDPAAPTGQPPPGSISRAALVVGPEGGWPPAERESLTRLGCLPLRLGARVLRIETAAVVGAGWLLAATRSDGCVDTP